MSDQHPNRLRQAPVVRGRRSAEFTSRHYSDPDLFKRGMRRLAAGLTIVTTIDEDGPHGFVATAVSSVSAEPHPSLLVCANKTSSTHSRIARSGIFCINILNESDAQIAQKFIAEEPQKRFCGIRWEGMRTGAPALSGALASFDCELFKTVDVLSHTIFIGSVMDICLRGDRVAPLVYIDGRFECVMNTHVQNSSRVNPSSLPPDKQQAALTPGDAPRTPGVRYCETGSSRNEARAPRSLDSCPSSDGCS